MRAAATQPLKAKYRRPDLQPGRLASCFSGTLFIQHHETSQF
jgi:hypothetical protein